jgi:Probable N6-adenine methyltransferase
LHEEATSLSDIEAKTFLLDIDSRFARFFPRTSFAQYNMFNNHFLTELGRDDYQSFISGVEAKNLLIVMDPPFGGRVEVLAHNLRRLFADIGGECSVAWIFPYFMEKHIIREFANFKMLDYKIEYDNHRKFKKTNSASSRASPVRLFTNVKPESIPHSSEEGYWFCKECRRFSAGENKHCLACGLCPSKDGKVWRHCRTCSQCVKSDWIHCKKCQRCHGKDCVAKTELSVKSNHLRKK